MEKLKTDYRVRLSFKHPDHETIKTIARKLDYEYTGDGMIFDAESPKKGMEKASEIIGLAGWWETVEIQINNIKAIRKSLLEERANLPR